MTQTNAPVCRRHLRRRRLPRSSSYRTSGARLTRCAGRLRNFRQPVRTASSCRSSIRLKRPFLIPDASNSSSRKAAAPLPLDGPRPGRRNTKSEWPAIAPRSEKILTGWVGALPSTAPIDLRPNYSSRCMPAWVLHRQEPLSAAVSPCQANSGGTRDVVAPAWLRTAANVARPVEHSGPVVAVAVDPATATPHRFPADTIAVRHRAEGGNAAANAVVADPVAADARHARHPRGCGTIVESTSGDCHLQGAAGAAHRRRLPRRRNLEHAYADRGRFDRSR